MLTQNLLILKSTHSNPTPHSLTHPPPPSPTPYVQAYLQALSYSSLHFRLLSPRIFIQIVMDGGLEIPRMASGLILNY